MFLVNTFFCDRSITVSVLIGRDQELKTLEKALHAARGGIGCCILLTGEAGIGKTRLIEELKQQAAAENFTILQGNCFEQSLSFGATH